MEKALSSYRWPQNRCKITHFPSISPVSYTHLVIHAVDTAVTDCQPNENIEALRVFMLSKRVECRPLWKPMHKQPVYELSLIHIYVFSK